MRFARKTLDSIAALAGGSIKRSAALAMIAGAAVMSVGTGDGLAAISGTPVTTVTNYTGGDAGDGIALTGTYLVTANIAKQTAGSITLQGYSFAPQSNTQSSPNFTGYAATDIALAGFAAYDYGASANDDALETIADTVANGLDMGFQMSGLVNGGTYQFQAIFPAIGPASRDTNVFLEGVPVGFVQADSDDFGGNKGGKVLTSVFTYSDADGFLDINMSQDANSQNGSIVAAMTLKAVPEPGSLALLGLGGLALIRRQRQA